MRTAAHGATCLVAACLLGGCASSPAVRQAKLNDPIIVVTVQSTTKKTPDKPTPPKAELETLVKQQERMLSILGAVGKSDDTDANGVFGGVVGGVIGGPGEGFGGLGLRGVGIGGGGTGQGIGIGSIGTFGHGSGYGGGLASLLSAGGGSTSERSKVKLGNVVISGALTVDVVQRHIDDHRNDIQTCHHLEYEQAGNRWGSVTMRLMIDSSGHVSDVQVYETTLSSRDLENCIAHVIGAFVFPASTSGSSATVLLPITF
jgi:hypothetical protein